LQGCEATIMEIWGRFTPFTLKSDHGRRPFSMVWLSWSDFFTNQFISFWAPR
jgi:hypothetical protein